MFDIYNSDFIYIFVGVIILAYLSVHELYICLTKKKQQVVDFQQTRSYGYGKCDGPSMWKENFPYTTGECQSPINLLSDYAIVVHCETLRCPLEFSKEYNFSPPELYLYNDGHTINLYPEYRNCKIPTLTGGPLNGIYELYSLTFRWGPKDEEGTEHMIDNEKYDMEMQVTFLKNDQRNILIAAQSSNVMIIAYLYQATILDNPYFENITKFLGQSSKPFQRCKIEPIPISFLAPPFSKKYFSYNGSLTYPPCTEGVQWIVQTEPLSLSQKQLKKFRKTPMLFCELKHNIRPVQELGNREIIFYD